MGSYFFTVCRVEAFIFAKILILLIADKNIMYLCCCKSITNLYYETTQKNGEADDKDTIQGLDLSFNK